MDYPKHLSEKMREEVAVSYLKHELRKIFPSIEGRDVDDLMKNKEISRPRDFWNGLHGISMGFKLKNILHFVTAENVKWIKTKVKCAKLHFGCELESTKKVGPGKICGQDYLEYYNSKILEKDRLLEKLHSLRGERSQREEDPIIAVQKGGKIFVLDGNGRLARHLIEGIEEINVYLGSIMGEKVENYWLATSLLIDVLTFCYQAIEKKDDDLFKKYVAILGDMLKSSESGKKEFKERALTKKEPYRSKILLAIGDDLL
ncbi:hypothetical protein KKD37_02785 [Patescibacteria group bacterium]|nr:hypothetical protein [Patescibacteria group bacterium]